jgi:hypothetical protein
MAHFKDKLQVFFLGILLGLLLGGSFFLFKLDQYVKELSIYKSLTHNKEQTFENPDRKGEKATEKNNPKPYYPTVAGNISHVPTVRDSSPVTDKPTIAERTIADSIKISDSSALATMNREEFVIRKDERITSRTVEIQNNGPVASNSVIQKDSVAAKMAGVREDHPYARQYAVVEFWSSPLNYKGYKMSLNKVILYGLSESENVRLYKLEDEIYLQSGSSTFHLEYSNEFHPYEKVTSELLLAKLK